jgi:hypothetical protein
MAIDLPQINCTAYAAARAEHVKPRRPRDQRGPDRRRPQHVPAGEKLLIPAFDDGLRLRARGSIGNLPLGVFGNVQAPRPHAHAAVSPNSGRATIAPPGVSTLARVGRVRVTLVRLSRNQRFQSCFNHSFFIAAFRFRQDFSARRLQFLHRKLLPRFDQGFSPWRG